MPDAGVTSVGTAEREAAHHDTAPPAEVPLDAAALLSKPVLPEGEVVLLFLKPSVWFVPLTCLGSILAALAVTGAVVWVGPSIPVEGVGPQQLVSLVVSLLGLRLGWQVLEWFSHVYILTDRRVIRSRGVLRTTVFDAPLPRLADPVLHTSLRERLFGLGTLSFTLRTLPGDEEETTAAWRVVRNPHEVHRMVVQTLHRYRGGASS